MKVEHHRHGPLTVGELQKALAELVAQNQEWESLPVEIMMTWDNDEHHAHMGVSELRVQSCGPEPQTQSFSLIVPVQGEPVWISEQEGVPC